MTRTTTPPRSGCWARPILIPGPAAARTTASIRRRNMFSTSRIESTSARSTSSTVPTGRRIRPCRRTSAAISRVHRSMRTIRKSTALHYGKFPHRSVRHAALLGMGYSVSNSSAGNHLRTRYRRYALMGLYRIDPFKFFAGYEHIKYANPNTPLSAGFGDIGNYVLAFVNNKAYNTEKTVQVYWTGARYTILPHLDLTAAYYRVHQDAYGTGSQAGCSSAAHSTCSGSLQAISFDADYRFTKRFDGYVGAMYSGVARWACQRLLLHHQHQSRRWACGISFSARAGDRR